LWSWSYTLKIKLFTWIVVENKILTWDILQRCGFRGPGKCQLCNQSSESAYHLFLECSFVTKVWNLISSSLSLTTRWLGGTFLACFKSWYAQITLYPSLLVVLCWYIWKERNLATFEDGNPIPQKVAFLTTIDLRISIYKPKVSCRRNFPTIHEGGGAIG